MKVAVRRPNAVSGTPLPIGKYADVCCALDRLATRLVWTEPRQGLVELPDHRQPLRVALVMGTKNRPEFVSNLFARLELAALPSDLAAEIVLNIWLPKESVHELWFDGANDPPDPIVQWAADHRWQVEELPGPGRVWFGEAPTRASKKRARSVGDT